MRIGYENAFGDVDGMTARAEKRQKRGLLSRLLFNRVRQEPRQHGEAPGTPYTLRWAAILFADMARREWRAIGVIAQDGDGNVLIRTDPNSPLVRAHPTLQHLAAVFNEEFLNRKVSFYRRDPGESASHVEILCTTAPDFLDKYNAELAAQGKHIRLFNIRTRRATRPLGHIIDQLLPQALTAHAHFAPRR